MGEINRNTPYNELPLMLRVEELRAVLGIGRATVYRMLKSDDIQPYIKRTTGGYFINKEFLKPNFSQANVFELQKF